MLQTISDWLFCGFCSEASLGDERIVPDTESAILYKLHLLRGELKVRTMIEKSSPPLPAHVEIYRQCTLELITHYGYNIGDIEREFGDLRVNE